MHRWIAPSLAALLAAAAAAAAAPAAAQDLSLTYIGQQVVPAGATAFGTTVGGLSGIDYDPATGRYVAISDDQANARFYTLDLDFDRTSFSGVNFTGVTTFRTPTGSAYAAGSIDPESIRFGSSSRVIYSSEGFAGTGVNPFVRAADLDGSYVGDYAVPAYYNPATGRGVRNNLGFESLTLADGGATVVAATENALVQDGPAATGSTGSPSRILAISALSRLPFAEFVYQNDAVATPPADGAFAVNGLVELLALGGTQYLALERSYTVGAPGTGYSIKLYGIDTAGATDVLGLPSLADASYTPVSKRLLFDLGTLGIPLDNVEGVTFGETLDNGQRSLILVADDNFSAAQQQQFLAFAIGAVPESDTWAMMIVGIGAVGTTLRRRERRAAHA